VIRNGIDPVDYRPGPGAGQPFTFLFLGRLTEEKGIPLLLEIAHLLASRPDLRIVVAGDGPLRTAVEQAARSAPVLEFVGPQQEVRALYHRAGAVLMPSLSEGLPMTALEGMACGLPILASAAGGIPELVADGVTGVLMRDREVFRWIEVMQRLAASPAWAAELGHAGRRRVESEFSEARMLDHLAATYREAVG
jgi:glycosyltransferase involved in cell wall biosynthesis